MTRFESDIFDLITPKACVNGRNITGGPASEAVNQQITDLRRFAQIKAIC